MPRINFFEEDIAVKLKNKAGLRQWLTETITTEGYRLKELNYIFCTDAYLLQINRQYLDHDTYTDIITFDNSEIDKTIIGDIFISVERVRENALKFNAHPDTELHRVMIHGALHLLGYKDKDAASKNLMTQMEDQYLAKRSF